MSEFESLDTSKTEQNISEKVMGIQIGTVAKVFEHTTESDQSNFEANVSLRDEEKERRRVPILQPFNGALRVPKKGEMVLVGFLDGSGERPIIIGSMYNDADRAPLGEAGIYRLRKGNLYVEMHPNGDWARIASKSTDDGTPEAKVEVDTNGNVNLDSTTGQVNIGSADADMNVHPSVETVELYQSSTLESGGASPFNWNATDWTTVSWDSEHTTRPSDSPYSVTLSETGDSYIEVLESGIYEITVSGLFYTADVDISVAKRLTKNGTPLGSLNTSDDSTGTEDQVPGAFHIGPYTGATTNHNNASTEFSIEMELQANDTLRVETRENAETGNLHPIGTHTTFRVEQKWTSE